MTDRTCAELFDHTHATIIGDADRPILGVAYRSDQVSPGDAFCCIVGLKADGHAFAQDAVDRGATVLVVERMLPSSSLTTRARQWLILRLTSIECQLKIFLS